jgi:hypothetical protein
MSCNAVGICRCVHLRDMKIRRRLGFLCLARLLRSGASVSVFGAHYTVALLMYIRYLFTCTYTTYLTATCYACSHECFSVSGAHIVKKRVLFRMAFSTYKKTLK